MSVPIAWPPVERFSLCSTKPDHFGPDEHTQRPRHPKMSARALPAPTRTLSRSQQVPAPLCREVSRALRSTPVSLCLDSQLESRTSPDSSKSFTLLEWHRHLGGLKCPSRVGFSRPTVEDHLSTRDGWEEEERLFQFTDEAVQQLDFSSQLQLARLL